MNERRRDESVRPEDPGRSSEPEPTPGTLKPSNPNRDKAKVTPLDEDKNVEDGIEIKET